VQTVLPGTEAPVVPADDEPVARRTDEPVAHETDERTKAGAPTAEALGGRFAAFLDALERPLVFFDTETTGTDPQNDRIIEIALLRVSPLPIGIEPPRTWRVNPGVRIPIEATRVHGIRNDDIADAPRFGEIADEILEAIDGADLAGFNVGRFDIRILQSELARVGKSLDPSTRHVVDAQVIFHQREPRTLSAALRFYRGRELEDAHGAEADAVAALEVFAGQLERYPDLGLDVAKLHELSNAINDAYCDVGRRFHWRDNEPVFGFGKLKGRSLRAVASDPEHRKYLRWMLDGDFHEDAKTIVREALDGKIRRREA
jgi:DNA polymerase-3 subunit epsilon